MVSKGMLRLIAAGGLSLATFGQPPTRPSKGAALN